MVSLALRRSGEAAADSKTIAGLLAAKAEGRSRLPSRRWRLEGSRAGNSALVNEKTGRELSQQWGGSLVEVIEAAPFYAAHFACEVPCPKKSCKAEVGKCCVTSDGKPTVVHKKRAEAWAHKDDAPPEPGTKEVKPIDVACPKCKAAAGKRCRNRWGGPASYHGARSDCARGATARAATAAAGAAAPAVVEAPPSSPSPPAIPVPPAKVDPLDVACPYQPCRAKPGEPCNSLGQPVSTHKPRIYAADPSQSQEVKREPALRAACPTCNSPKYVRCVTAAKKFTKAHADRVAAWLASEEQGR